MLEGWYFIAAALLVLSGGSKFRDPEPTRGALRAARLPSSRSAVAAFAAVEILVGAAALAFGSRFAALALGVIYLAFGLFVLYALASRLPIRSCGCFGKADTPPGWTHVAIDLGTAAVAGTLAFGGGADLAATLSDQPAAGIPYLAFVAIGAFLAALVIAELPAVLRRKT
jgi:hypothetical protein